jgi:hypothetical protein
VLASTAGTTDSLKIRVNPQTLNEAVRIYSALGAKMPFLQEIEEFVANCLLHSAETFAVCSHRIILCHYLIGQDVVYWYGNGKVKDPEPLDNVIFFAGDNSRMIASILLEQALFRRLQPFLAPQPSTLS